MASVVQWNFSMITFLKLIVILLLFHAQTVENSMIPKFNTQNYVYFTAFKAHIDYVIHVDLFILTYYICNIRLKQNCQFFTFIGGRQKFSSPCHKLQIFSYATAFLKRFSKSGIYTSWIAYIFIKDEMRKL